MDTGRLAPPCMGVFQNGVPQGIYTAQGLLGHSVGSML